MKKILNIFRGVLTMGLLLIWLLILGTLVLLTAGIIFLFPKKSWRHKGKMFLLRYPILWMSVNNLIMEMSTHGKWDIKGSGELSKDHWYLLISNHVSWADILVISCALHRKIPPIKFFMKKELMWMLPIAGFGVYFLDYPFLGRHTREDIRKNPALKGADIQTTKEACEKFKTIPTAIINFCEGTRFTEEKRERQQSPYQHLLKPKSGGIAVVLYELQDYLDSIINITLRYSPKNITLWDFCCGNFEKIKLRYETLPVTPAHIGNYYEDRAFRARFQQWLNDVWLRKEQLINELDHK